MRYNIPVESRRFAQSTTITTRAIPTRALNKGISYFEVEILKLHSVDGYAMNLYHLSHLDPFYYRLIAIGYEQDSEPVTASLPKRDFQHAVGAVPNSWGYNSKGIVNCCGNTALDSHYAPMFRGGSINYLPIASLIPHDKQRATQSVVVLSFRILAMGIFFTLETANF